MRRAHSGIELGSSTQGESYGSGGKSINHSSRLRSRNYTFNGALRYQACYIHICVCCRSQACVGSALPPYKVGSLNSKLFLSELSKREKSLRKTLEGRIKRIIFTESSLLYLLVCVGRSREFIFGFVCLIPLFLYLSPSPLQPP